MRSLGLTTGTIGLAIAGLGAQGHSHTSRAAAELDSTQEAPAVISPAAAGTFTAVIDERSETVQYHLQFDGLEAPLTQSHIHIAQPDVSGAIVVWLCQTAAAPQEDCEDNEHEKGRGRDGKSDPVARRGCLWLGNARRGG